MRKPEAKYRYLLNKDKYDPEVNEAVDKKKLTEKDANTVNKIQEMMRAEREKKGTRNIVTSENREEFMAKKLKLDKPKEDEVKEKVRKEDKPHAIYNKETGVIHSRYPNFAKARMTFENMGKRAEEHEIKEMEK